MERGEVHVVSGGLRAGPVVVVSGDMLNTREDQRPWVLAIYPAPAETPDPGEAYLVRTAEDDPVTGFVAVHDVRRPMRRAYRPAERPDRLGEATMRRIDSALRDLLELSGR